MGVSVGYEHLIWCWVFMIGFSRYFHDWISIKYARSKGLIWEWWLSLWYVKVLVFS